jgi:hypothetical protein
MHENHLSYRVGQTDMFNNPMAAAAASTGYMGKFNGQLGHMNQFGQMGHMNQFGQMGHMNQFGGNMAMNELQMAHQMALMGNLRYVFCIFEI